MGFIAFIIIALAIANSIILEEFYLYTKKNELIKICDDINYYYNNLNDSENIELQLDKISSNNNIEIVILDKEDIIYMSGKNFLTVRNNQAEIQYKTPSESIIVMPPSIVNGKNNRLIYEGEGVNISISSDNRINSEFISLTSSLDNGYQLYARLAVESIKESVKISNDFLIIIGSIIILVGAISISFIARVFTNPIRELNDIAKQMAKLDFSKKYDIKGEDELNQLGDSINVLSERLETTIKQLRNSNIELERDVEEKSKIDEMRKQFVSDVSHELKTPIALIQGYAEGLKENVIQDEESKRFYCEVILDEANKMDRLVKQLLELSKLEYGSSKLNKEKFDIVHLISDELRKSDVILKEKSISVNFDSSQKVEVLADELFICQVVTNYITNAMNYLEGERNIEIKVEQDLEREKAIIKVYNTGRNIAEEDIPRIWNRFYKADTSRNRETGGTGIGLSLVKAIMNIHENRFGVENKENGVEFYFEVDLFVQ